MNARAVTAVACAAMLLAACGDTSSPPTARPGAVIVSVARPDGLDVALMLRVTGPGLDAGTVQAVFGVQHVYARTAPGGVNVAVFGLPATAPLVRLQVPDVNRLTDYSATVVEAAAANNALRTIAGYSVTLTADQ